jgi:membrane peptidoglycan carboxypeptidase
LSPYQEALIDLLQTVVQEGTGRAAQLDGFAAGKTGTTENHRDAWFVGFTKDLVAGVWVGNDNNEPMNEVTGGYLPAMIWKEFMAGATELPAGEDIIGSGYIAGVAQCDYAACSRSYRSFRASDCTYQPYQGPRKLCQHGGPQETQIAGGFYVRDLQERERMASAGALMTQAFAGQDEERGLSAPAIACNYDACAQSYRTFRPSDCTYQPYSGPRRLCTRGSEDDMSFDNGFSELFEAEPEDEEETFEGALCNYEACGERYRSFRASDCTYQPYQGRRRYCRLSEDIGEMPTTAEEDFEYGAEYDDLYIE